MGYACPVCGDPQADDIHLANHLAFTAISRGGDHEEWLDEIVPGWGSMNEETLAEAVTDHADEKEYPQVFEDTTAQHDHNHEHGHSHGRSAGTQELSEAMLAQAENKLDDMEMADADDVLEEAREMTEQRRTDDDSETE